MGHQPDSHSVRRIVLPSGRAIEVIRLGPAVGPQHGLHICPECSSPLVQPVAWGETAGGFWALTLQCPNCDWLTEGVFDQDQVDVLEEQLDEGLDDMLGDLRRLTQANMAAEIDRFSAALESDAILPEDF
ncbi:MAG: hypothetical protein M3022_16230 [Actinomycetota bacterium]|nr:hypothetical protein [Actinomycetota bacterium]